MSRIVCLTTDQIAELEHLADHAEELEVRRRARVVLLLHAGYTSTHLAQELGVCRKTIYNIAQKFRLQGTDGLFARTCTGRPGKADARYRQLLTDTLAHVPADFGYHDLGWTTHRLREHMAEQTEITLSLTSLKDLLHEMGYVYRRQPPRIDSLLPPMPKSLQKISGWLDLRDSLQADLPEWMSRSYHSWVKG